MTPILRRTLEALRDHGPCGPAHLSGFVWPDRQTAIRRGAAPGTGLVRPMLAILARLRKAELVWWESTNGNPVEWKIGAKGLTALRHPAPREIP